MKYGFAVKKDKSGDNALYFNQTAIFFTHCCGQLFINYQPIVKLTLLPNPISTNLYKVDNCISLWPFSILEIKLL